MAVKRTRVAFARLSHLCLTPSCRNQHSDTTQISLGMHPIWSVTSLSAWNFNESLAISRIYIDDIAQTRRLARLTWVFTVRLKIQWVLSYHQSTQRRLDGQTGQMRMLTWVFTWRIRNFVSFDMRALCIKERDEQTQLPVSSVLFFCPIKQNILCAREQWRLLRKCAAADARLR